eukprot:108886-Alexandrium_andersonii.AAC.1
MLLLPRPLLRRLLARRALRTSSMLSAMSAGLRGFSRTSLAGGRARRGSRAALPSSPPSRCLCA